MFRGSYVEGFLHPGVLTMRGSYNKGFLHPGVVIFRDGSFAAI